MSKNKQVICPVTKTSVNKTTAAKQGLVREYKGQKYYFCCPDCPRKFDKNPAQYLNPVIK